MTGYTPHTQGRSRAIPLGARTPGIWGGTRLTTLEIAGSVEHFPSGTCRESVHTTFALLSNDTGTSALA